MNKLERKLLEINYELNVMLTNGMNTYLMAKDQLSGKEPINRRERIAKLYEKIDDIYLIDIPAGMSSEEDGEAEAEIHQKELNKLQKELYGNEFVNKCAGVVFQCLKAVTSLVSIQKDDHPF